MKISHALTAALLLAPASSALADETFTSKNDLDKRPVTAIAAELGVEPQQFADCFALVTPASDFNPSGERQQANKALLLPCLQTANPAITNDLLDSVMDKYRGQHV
ncbi:MAG: hypothetical protein H6873_11795 [Hyphomicrobiaceae bacterium]|nr:hypothetical protein [Hyphomicrobiaceae bacterium]